MKSVILKGAACSLALATLFTAASVEARPSRATNGAKYVFLFVGDGMASVQVQAAEAYLASKAEGGEDTAANLLNPDHMLNMNKLPITGLSTTYADTRFITGSAAAATAFACGAKTSIRTIGMDSTETIKYKSIAELAKEQGRAVGIISSVSLPHATPAAFYANVGDRGMYNEIGYQASQSGFDFFGGGWFRKLDQTDNSAGVVLEQAFLDAGYTTVTNIADLASVSGKVICSVATSYDSDAMPYAIDRPAENFSLEEVTTACAERLAGNPNGFFIMVEGGKIDWAGHANDAMANIGDTLAFDDAVGAALNFMTAHPNETLIVVTGDHETGGMSLGFAGTVYETAFNVLEGQTMSYDRFVANVLEPYKADFFTSNGLDSVYVKYQGTQCTNGQYNAAIWNIDGDLALQDAISNNFGLAWAELSDYQKDLLEAAYDRTMSGEKDDRFSGYDLDGATDVDYVTYGGYEALTMTLCHILNNEAGLQWTSTSHTAVPVPVYAAGFDAYRFNGFYDNTDIAKSLATAMRIRAKLPVIDND